VKFPKDFVWGAATAAYQIEGGAFAGSKGLNSWDVFTRVKNAVYQSHTGDVACDHVNRLSEDVALLKWLRVDSYRFSVNWSRVIPDGSGKVASDGLEFYDRLVDALLDAEINPLLTCFHWDYPAALLMRGGWLHPDSPEWFAEYVNVLVERLSDRVSDWITMNEPQVFLGMGHRTGEHAPGWRLDWDRWGEALLNTLRAHGKATQVIRQNSKKPPKVSIAPCSIIGVPESDNAADVAAAEAFTFRDQPSSAAHWCAKLYLDPILRGEFPQEYWKATTGHELELQADDLKLMNQPLDYLSLNYYSGERIRANANGTPKIVKPKPGEPLTMFSWPIMPRGMYYSVKFHYERYNLPIMITENGLASMDWVTADGTVPDYQRIDFLNQYLESLSKAVADGYPVLGYFHWSLLDNFEWAEGYKQRFGLIHVDFETQVRTPKASAHWYRDLLLRAHS
jgi:beta-glucosidase